MSITVPIVEVVGGKEARGRGEYELRGVPVPGDQVVLPSPAGDLQIARVLYCEYTAIRLPKGKFTESEEPTITVYVEVVGIDSGGNHL